MSRLVKSVVTISVVLLLLLPIAVVGMQQLTGSPSPPLLARCVDQLPITLTSSLGMRAADPVVIGCWPPVAAQTYPDLILTDQTGTTTRLSDFRGKLLLIEYAAISCPGCQAFAGGQECGAYLGFSVQPKVESIERYARQYAGVELGSDDVVFIQVLLYGKDLKAPRQNDVEGWARHFGMNRNNNRIVLRGDASLLSRETYNMIPGFHLVDRDFLLRSDSCGHHPKDDLYTDLLPLLGQLARQH